MKFGLLIGDCPRDYQLIKQPWKIQLTVGIHKNFSIMTYRPNPEHRKNIQGVLMPLTAAVYLVFGSRAQDNGRPLGAFYPKNVSHKGWEHLGGILYRARDEQSVLNRKVNVEVVQSFARSIRTGDNVVLRDGSVIAWEKIPDSDASKLPPPLSGV